MLVCCTKRTLANFLACKRPRQYNWKLPHPARRASGRNKANTQTYHCNHADGMRPAVESFGRADKVKSGYTCAQTAQPTLPQGRGRGRGQTATSLTEHNKFFSSKSWWYRYTWSIMPSCMAALGLCSLCSHVRLHRPAHVTGTAGKGRSPRVEI
jgi:hypothetical protein